MDSHHKELHELKEHPAFKKDPRAEEFVKGLIRREIYCFTVGFLIGVCITSGLAWYLSGG